MGHRYFLGFDGVRAVAALAIVIHHIEQFRELILGGRSSFPQIVLALGQSGVDLFFVLSGFLITFLLLQERYNIGSISAKKFYVRRALRILPLYFLIVLLSFGVFPEWFVDAGGLVGAFVEYNVGARNAFFGENFVLFVLLLPNFSLILFPPVLFASQLWSIGVEEQFYFVWPWIMKIKRFATEYIVLGILGLKVASFFAVSYILQTGGAHEWKYAWLFLRSFRLECMAIGALGAILLLKHEKKIQRILASRLFDFLCPALIFGTLLFPFQYLSTLTSSMLYTVAILALQFRGGGIFENRVMRYLGRISYGIYMFHPIAIITAMLLVQEKMDSPWATSALYFLSFVLTILISSLSYRFYESPFLKIKNNFSDTF